MLSKILKSFPIRSLKQCRAISNISKEQLEIPLKEKDPEIFNLIKEEQRRQFEGIELIASENFTSRAVLDCLGSCLTNKYSEGYPGERYYGGNFVIDKIERLCQKRALQLFGLSPEEWGVNVQPYSGSPANLAVYTGLIPVGGRIMGLDLPSGGHLTHGFQNEKKKISATSLFFSSKPYYVNQETGYIDYERCEKLVNEFKPNILICGYSAYSRDLEYDKFRKYANQVKAYLMADISHFSGLVSSGEFNSPFEYCDIVTTTTHKSLRGPRAGMIFYRKACLVDGENLGDKINFAVFPMLQGGPHNHQIAAIATQLLEAQSEEFKEYARNVKKNAKALANSLMSRGIRLMTGGTDNHMVLVDMKPQNLSGPKMEKLCEKVHISLNKNSIAGDAGTVTGIRIGTPAMTTRGCNEKDMDQIAEFFFQGTKIAVEIQKKSGKKLTDFVKQFDKNEDIIKLGTNVKAFAKQFPIPGFDVSDFN